MPIKIPNGLPAIEILKNEGISVISELDALRQDIRPLRIALLNLMPDKKTTETQIARVVGATPLQIEMTLLRTASYTGRHTAEEHLTGFYTTWDRVQNQNFDGLIVTGAPVEHMPFENVDYWDELKAIFEWSKKHTFSQFYICWGAQAALYHFNNVPKRETPKKQFGVFPHCRHEFNHPLVRGFDDIFNVPVSRHTEVVSEAVHSDPSLKIMAVSDETGIGLIYDENHRRVFMFNHLEYDGDTLKREFDRDRSKGIDIAIPPNYFPDNDPERPPLISWRAHRHLLFANWVDMVYQATPKDLAKLPDWQP